MTGGKFEELGQYLGVNDHIRLGVGISEGPSSGLEKQIEEALGKGDVTTAEQLSDKLATRNVKTCSHLYTIL
mgnify:CR=1 FL=1